MNPVANVLWERDLGGQVSVSAAGLLVGPDDNASEPMGRIVVVMPDGYAQRLAGILGAASLLASAYDWSRPGPVEIEPSVEHDLAKALAEAAQVHRNTAVDGAGSRDR